MKVKPRKKTKNKSKTKTKFSYICPHCSKQFKDSSAWGNHVKLHTTENPYQCEICDYTCKIKKYLTRHMRKTHTKPTGNQCPICGKCFHFDCKLRDHMRVHTGEKPYKCNVCDKAFSSRYSLSGHKFIHTGEKPFQCLYCEYACRDSSTIRKHMERHLGITKDYPCSICNKNFKCKETLQIHVDEVHFELDTRKYPCEQCTKIFKTKKTLYHHRNTVHSESNRVQCEICNIGISKNNLQAHMRRHVDVKPYKCSFKPCGKRFKDKGDLRKHSLIHYPDRQYQCSMCEKRFPRKTSLGKHMLLHKKGRVVQCDHCLQMFQSKKFVLRHIRYAHGSEVKKYICNECGMIIYNRPLFIKHVKYAHGTENETKCRICKKDYNNYHNLKEHYLKHNVTYSLIGAARENDVIVKEEPSEQLEETVDPPEFMYEVDIQKHEIDAEFEVPVILAPTSPENFNIDADTITYSKKVLSEDISRSLIERDGTTEDAFDDFFIGHVMKKPEEIDMPTQIIDEEKKEKVEKCLEKLLTEVRMRRECNALEKLRRQYNIRIKMATSGGNKKEQTSIRYFKKTDTNVTVQPENDKDSNINDKDKEKSNDSENQDIAKNIVNDDENDKVNSDENDKVNDEPNEKGDDSDDNEVTDDRNKDRDYKESDFENNSDEETNENRKLKFNTHQCYICFKLFKTKTELKRHCTEHFDICNEKMLKKCPFCGYVTNKLLTKHIRVVHNVDLDIPYGRIKERDTEKGSKYVFEINKNCDLEIIPSISNLNKIASMKIDEKNRKSKNVFLGKTKLVKKGNGWVVEKTAVDVNIEYLLPEFSIEEYQSLKSFGSTYLERMKNLSILAKKKGLKILYPCEGCDKICLCLSALKLHNRKHEANPKRFKPKVWKHKLLKNGQKNGNNRQNRGNNSVGSGNNRQSSGNNRQNGGNNNKNSVANNENIIKTLPKNDKRRKLAIVSRQNENVNSQNENVSSQNENTAEKLANRFADPNPVKNKHKCDKELIEFYKNNIKGGDIEFWQFLKIFNKMTRENVNDFKDLNERHDFGMHNIKNPEVVPTENSTEPPVKNNRVVRKKTGINLKKAFTRAIMISKKEYLKRNEIKNQMRKRLETCSS